MPKASISHVSKGNRILVQIKTGVDENGKDIRKSKYCKTEEEALALKEEWDRQYANTVIPKVINQPRAGMPFVDYINYYYKNEHSTCGNRTLDSYFVTCRTIRNKLTEMGIGNITLGDMTEDVIIKVLKSLAADNKSQSTIDKVRLVFTQTIGEPV